MRILLASSSSGSKGGGELFLAYLAEELSSRGHQVGLWCSEHPKMDMLVARCSPFTEILRHSYLGTYDRKGRVLSAILDRKAPLKIAQQWSDWNPEVIHVNKQNLEDGAELLAASNICVASDTPQERPPVAVCTVHITQTARFLGAKGSWLRDRLARVMLKRYAGTLVAVGPLRSIDLKGFMQTDRCKVLTAVNGVPLPEASIIPARRQEKRLELGLENRLCVLAVGRLVDQKKPLRFLDEALRLHAILPDALFIWLGDGDLAGEWDRKVQALGLSEVVRRIDWVDDPGPWYAAADVLLHTASYEGLPLAILEAMGWGLPCVISDDILAEGALLNETGVSPLSDVTRWDQWLRSSAMRSEASAANRQTALSRFSVQSMTDRYENIYRADLPQTQC